MGAPTVGFTVQFKCVDMAPEGEPPVLWAVISQSEPDDDGMVTLTLARGAERQTICADVTWCDSTIEAQPRGEFHWTGWIEDNGG